MTQTLDCEPQEMCTPRPSEMMGTWIVAQVRGLYERRIAEMLSEVEVGHYLPIEQIVERDATGKKRHKERLLFPNYLFACCRHDDDYYELVARPNVHRIIKVADQVGLVSYLDSLHIALSSGAHIDRYPHIAVGRECEIVNGPLRGVKGVVIRKGEQDVIVVQLKEFMNGSSAIDVNIGDIELVD